MMKRTKFLAGLGDNLHWKVELKKPRSYEEALEIARSKEWKLQRLSQLGIDANATRLKMRRVEPTSMSNIAPMMMPQVVDTPIVHPMPQMLPTVPMATPIAVATYGLR